MRRVVMTAPMMRRSECLVDGRLVRLTPGQTNLLAVLLLKGPVFTLWDELIEAVWPDPDLEPDQARRVLDVHMVRLRKRGIEIETWWGEGLRIPVEARGNGAPIGCRQMEDCQRRTEIASLCQPCSNRNRNERQLRKGLTPEQLRTWRYLRAHHGATQQQMADHFGVCKGSINKRLVALLAKGLAKRVVKPGQRKGKVFATMVRTSPQLLHVCGSIEPGPVTQLRRS